jgi:hypothetical protein
MTTSLPRSVSHVPDLDPETRFSIEASILVRGSFPIAQSTVIDASLIPFLLWYILAVGGTATKLFEC